MEENENKDSVAEEAATEQEVTQEQIDQVAEQQSSLTDEDIQYTPESVLADIQQLESLAEIDPSILQEPEYLKLKETLANIDSEDGKKEKAPAKVDSEVPPAKKKEEETDEEDDKDEEDDGSDPFGLFKEKKDVPEIKLDENTLALIKEKYSIEDPEKFFGSVDTWRNQAQEGTEYKTKFTDIEEGIASLPNNIKAAISAYAEGQDYHAAFGSSAARLDYGSNFDTQDKDAVVQHYFEDKITNLKAKLTDEKIDEEDYAERYDELHELSEKLFNNDKKGFEKQRADYVKNQDRIEESRTNSINSSVQALKKDFPNFSQADLQRVQQRMVDGTIEEPFLEKDGSYRKGAAKQLAFAMYGEMLVKSLLNKASKDGESKANKKIVDRSNKEMREGSKGQQETPGKEHIEAVSHLDGHFDEDPYA